MGKRTFSPLCSCLALLAAVIHDTGTLLAPLVLLVLGLLGELLVGGVGDCLGVVPDRSSQHAVLRFAKVTGNGPRQLHTLLRMKIIMKVQRQYNFNLTA